MIHRHSASVARTAAAIEDDVEAHNRGLVIIGEVCERLAVGDFSARFPQLPGGEPLNRIRTQLNRMVDMMDAFVRESSASLSAAADGRFHRKFLVAGMLGAFGAAARTINTAHTSMAEAADGLVRSQEQRGALTERALEVSEQVAAASTELGASAASQAGSTHAAVAVADGALHTVEELERSAAQIREAVTVIKRVAAQTRLLALNATIEAARAADAGRGFAVVAGEVKTLADEVTGSSEQIERQVAAARQSAVGAVHEIRQIHELIAEMDQQVSGIAAAAMSGHAGLPGLSEMAETLRVEIHHLMDEDR